MGSLVVLDMVYSNRTHNRKKLNYEYICFSTEGQGFWCRFLGWTQYFREGGPTCKMVKAIPCMLGLLGASLLYSFPLAWFPLKCCNYSKQGTKAIFLYRRMIPVSPHGEFTPPSSHSWTHSKLSISTSPVTFNGWKNKKKQVLFGFVSSCAQCCVFSRWEKGKFKSLVESMWGNLQLPVLWLAFHYWFVICSVASATRIHNLTVTHK